MANATPVDYAGIGWVTMLSDDEAKLREPARDREEDEERDLDDGAFSTREHRPSPRNEDQGKVEEALAQPTSAANPPASASTETTEEPVGKWLKFWQGILHVDTSKMDLGIGFRNALGVAIPLAVGIAIKMPLG